MLRVTDVTPIPGNLSGIPIGRFPDTPVTSVTESQSVTFTKKVTENQEDNREVVGFSEVSPEFVQEYRDLYKHLVQSLTGEVDPNDMTEWDVPDSDLPTGQISFREYGVRLQALARSNDLAKITAGRDEILRKLGQSR